MKGAGAEAYWLEFCRSAAVPADARHDLIAFDETPAARDALLALVLAGPKRATAMLLLQVERGEEAMPEPGAHAIVLDGAGQPGAIVRTTRVEVRRFRDVDAAFAWDEGEDDRSLASWRRGHLDYFGRVCARLGVAMSEDQPVVLERFALVWPLPVASFTKASP